MCSILLVICLSRRIIFNGFADKQNALRRECTFKIEIVIEIGVTGVHIYLKITVLTLSGF